MYLPRVNVRTLSCSVLSQQTQITKSLTTLVSQQSRFLHPHILYQNHKLLTPQKLEGPQTMGLASSLFGNKEAKFVEEAIKSDCVVIFSKTTCGFCRRTKSMFTQMDVPFTTIELNQREDGDRIQEVLHEMTGDYTVPRVFVNKKCVGGSTETNVLKHEGKLLDLIKQCHQERLKANL